jgi:hypothetical protein
MRLNRGLLSLFSGLGFTGLTFYVGFFTLYSFDWELTLLFVYTIATGVLGGVTIWCIFVAFDLITNQYHITPTIGGFIGGILTMVGIILMILSLRMDDIAFLDRIHPIVSFFLAAGCTTLLLYPIEEKETSIW